mgnify:CR=1 FL=1
MARKLQSRLLQSVTPGGTLRSVQRLWRARKFRRARFKRKTPSAVSVQIESRFSLSWRSKAFWIFADSPIKSWQSKLKSPYTPEVEGAAAKIASRVKLSERPSGFHDKLQRIGSLSISAAG